jgi:hypothetical protein
MSPEENFLKDNFIIEIKEEEKTRLQGVNLENFKEWANERTKRLHSSDFGRICKLTDRTDKDKYALSLTSVCRLRTVPIKHGLKFEKVAIEKYQTTKNNRYINVLFMCAPMYRT